jgi:hypothetical protein
MRRALVFAVIALMTSIACADVMGTIVASYPNGQAAAGGGIAAVSPYYDNTASFTGYSFANGGAQNQSGNTITTLVMDDIEMTAPIANVTDVYFTVANQNSVAVTVRPRVRFWGPDINSYPGTFISGGTFNPMTFNANTTYIIHGTGFAFAAPSFFWAGITFDDNTGGTGITVDQLNHVGQGVFDPPAVGSSSDLFAQTTTAGSFFGINNPAVGLFNFGGELVANFGWAFVPEPTTLVLLAVGALALRRR